MDKSQIINMIVQHAADIMASKADYLEIVAEQFEAKQDHRRAELFREDIQGILQAVELMRKLHGGWA